MQLGARMIAEGYDAAIGGGTELTPGVVARELARAHIVVVASPTHMAGRKALREPPDLAALDGIVMHAVHSGRAHLALLRPRMTAASQDARLRRLRG